MKKRFLSILLALAMALALIPAGSAAPASTRSSGSTTLSKLSKAEITQLLEDNPLTLPDTLFVTEPTLSSPYAPGKVADTALQAATDRLNALRRIAGLPSATLDTALCESAQYGAVLLAASAFSHYPPQPADMDNSFYQMALNATSSSNIYRYGTTGSSISGLTNACDSFMDDSDASNIDRLGHRRWQLNPTLGKVGFGYVKAKPAGSSWNYHYTAETVHDKSGSGCDYDFIGWPASGYFPSNLFDGDTAWSVTLNPSKYQTPSQSQLTVTLTRKADGQTWTFSGSNYTEADSGAYFNVDTAGYGVSNCIVFRPDGVKSYDGVYTVKIDGLKTSSGQAVTDFEYEVEFFNTDALTPAFTDVPSWFKTEVTWAFRWGITTGYGSSTTFAPGIDCLHTQILTFLWRAEGEPTAAQSPFTVFPSYQEAVNWAYEKGLIDSSFDPDAPCTRAQAVQYIWQAKSSPSPSQTASFSDVSAGAPYAAAVSWAVEKGVTKGYGGSDTFAPDQVCNRGEIAAFLYRAYN